MLRIATCVLLSAVPASAAIIYEYEGNPQVCLPNDAFCLDTGVEGTVLKGKMIIDETRVPLGLANASLKFEAELNDITGEFSPWTVTSNGVRETFGYDSTARWFRFSGDIAGLFDNLVFSGNVWEVEFDNDLNISSWGSTGDGFFGGSNDYGISSQGDGFAAGSSAPAGTWTILDRNAPAPIPLPASVLFLGGALGLLGSACAKRRNRSHSETIA